MNTLQPALLEALFTHMADAVYLIDPETSKILWCNRAGYLDLGYSAEELINHSVLSLQKDVTNLPQWQEIRSVIEANECFTFIGRHAKKDLTEISVEVNTSSFNYEDQAYFLSVARNITQRLSFEKEMKNKQDRIWFGLNQSSDGLWEWTISNNEVFFSPQLKRMLGYGPDEMEPNLKTWENNIHPDDMEHVMHALNLHLEGKRSVFESEYRLRNRSGHYLWVQDKGAVCERDSAGKPTHVVGMLRNITDSKNLQFQLEFMASRDPLTGLINRRAGEQQGIALISQALNENKNFSMLLLDLDFFKEINDCYGHQQGDVVLKNVAETLRHVLPTDAFAIRWGGDEFMILLFDMATDKVNSIAKQIHQTFQEKDCEIDSSMKLSLSIGIASLLTDGDDFNRLFKTADQALYQAKKQGRNQTYQAL